MNSKTEAIHYLYAEGYTYAEIAKRMGISRQRVQQIVRPPEHVRNAVIERAHGRCEACGITLKDGHIHHTQNKYVFDMENMNLLVYLCPSCHRQRHSTDEERQSYNMRGVDIAREKTEQHRRCPKCKGILTYIRIKAGERVCRGCGNVWKVVIQSVRTAP